MSNDDEQSLEDYVEISGLSLDDVGKWTVRKNDMVEYYAKIYSEIVGARGLRPSYIDGFANRGIARLRGSGEIIRGSPLRVLSIEPKFDRYFFVELDHDRANDLSDLVGVRSDVSIEVGDANIVLPTKIFPLIRFDRYERALCFLDPYNMRGLRWTTVAAAAKTEVIDVVVHFPVMDANRTVLWGDPSRVGPEMAAKMAEYWGDESWRAAAYTSAGFLFEDMQRRQNIASVIDAYRDRLTKVAGFSVVSQAMPMKNSIGAVIYYLIFASPNERARNVTRSLERKFGVG